MEAKPGGVGGVHGDGIFQHHRVQPVVGDGAALALENGAVGDEVEVVAGGEFVDRLAGEVGLGPVMGIAPVVLAVAGVALFCSLFLVDAEEFAVGVGQLVAGGDPGMVLEAAAAVQHVHDLRPEGIADKLLPVRGVEDSCGQMPAGFFEQGDFFGTSVGNGGAGFGASGDVGHSADVEVFGSFEVPAVAEGVRAEDRQAEFLREAHEEGFKTDRHVLTEHPASLGHRLHDRLADGLDFEVHVGV